MENSMTEYKKKSKFADLMDSLKFSAKIFFAGNNHEKILSAILTRNEEKRFEELEKYNDKLNPEDIFSIMKTLNGPKQIDYIEKYQHKMESKHLVDLIFGIEKENKLRLINVLERSVLDAEDIEKIVINSDFENSDKLKITRRFVNMGILKQEQLANIIASYDSDKQIEAINIFKDVITENGAKFVMANLDDKNKSEALFLLKNKIPHDEFSYIISSMDEQTKEELLSNNIDDLGTLEIGKIIKSIGEEKREELLSLNIEKLYMPSSIAEVIISMDEEKRERLLSTYEDRLDSYYTAEVIVSMDEEKREKLLSTYENRLDSDSICNIIVSVDNERKERLLSTYENKLDSGSIGNIIISMDEEKRENLLSTYEEQLSSYSMSEIILSMDKTKSVKLFDKYINKIDVKLLDTYLEKNLQDEERFNLIKDEEIGKETKFKILKSLENKDSVKIIVEENPELFEGIETDLMLNYIDKLDMTVLNERQLLTNEAIELLGEQEHYQLFKYIVIPKDMSNLDISTALDNPEKFKKYIQLKMKFNEKDLAIQNIASGIQEYSVNSKIINDFLTKDAFDENQIAIFKELVKDEPYDEIEKVEDLEKYPELRKEKFDKLIEENSRECTYEMLLGISGEEYKNISETFAKDKSLAEGLNEIIDGVPNEEKTRILEIISMLKVVDLVNEMPVEQRKEALRSFNENLANEFKYGSKIADIRKSMTGLRKDIRTIFGKELSQSLDIKANEETKIETIKDEGKDDIEVVHMEGEEFKILIHAVDAYGSGNGHFENRELGNQYICTSLISDKFMGRASGSPIVGFTNFGEESLIQEGSQDLWSYGEDRKQNSLNIKARHGTGFRKSDVLIEETVEKGMKYSEINLWREYMDSKGQVQTLIPSHIVCFDEIDELSKQEARLIAEKFGLDKPLPILLINTEKYKDRIEEYAKEVRERKEIQQQEVIKGKIEDKTISEKVEEIINIVEEKAEPRDIAKVQLELINSQEQTKEVFQGEQGYKKPTAMMSMDDGLVH